MERYEENPGEGAVSRSTLQHQRKNNSFLIRLSAAKEFVLILVVFVSGFFWVYQNFETIDHLDSKLEVVVNELKLHVNNELKPLNRLRDNDHQKTCMDSSMWNVLTMHLEILGAVNERLIKLAHQSSDERGTLAMDLEGLRNELKKYEEKIRKLMIENGDPGFCPPAV